MLFYVTIICIILINKNEQTSADAHLCCSKCATSNFLLLTLTEISVLGTAKCIVRYPKRALISAVNYSRKYGLNKNDYEEFDYMRNHPFSHKKFKAQEFNEDKSDLEEERRDLTCIKPFFPISLAIDTYFYQKLRLGDLKYDSIHMIEDDGERRFCGRKLEAKMIHRNDVIDRFEHLSKLSFTHTSEYCPSEFDSDENYEQEEVKSMNDERLSFSNIPSGISEEINSIRSNRSSFKSPKINSKLKIVFV